MCGIGHVVEATMHVRGVAKAALSEAASVYSQVEGRMVLLATQTETSTSRAIGEASQQLEKGLETVALGSVANERLEYAARLEGLCYELQAKFEQDRVELQ